MTNWKPSKKLNWQEDAKCASPENKDRIEIFFSNEPEEVLEAKNVCFTCPVRKECIKWALESSTIWGIWGGKDEQEIRRTLSVNSDGAEIRRDRYPQCLSCGARTGRLQTVIADNPDGGRWTTVRLVECLDCKFVWRSRTSSNAVNAYYAMVAEKKAAKEAQDALEAAEPVADKGI